MKLVGGRPLGYAPGVTKKTGYDVVVVGGGPSGMTAAYFAAKAGADVLLVDSRPSPGEKILLSGGGRCNVLPLSVEPEAYVTDSSPHSLRKILLSWPLEEVRGFLEGPIGLRLIEQKRTGKVFPAGSGGGADVRDAFIKAIRRTGVKVRGKCRVVDVLPDERRRVVVESGPGIVASHVVVATGGMSYPQTGSTGFGFEIAQRLGHGLIPPYPALVPLYGGTPAHHGLAGLSLPVRLLTGDGKQRTSSAGDFLFTHRGYSGPVVLNAAHAIARWGRANAAPGAAARPARPALRVSWLDRSASDWESILVPGPGTVRTALSEALPGRLGDVLLDELDLRDAEKSTLRRDDRARILKALSNYELPIRRAGGFGEAEVTGGGVPLGEVFPSTLGSRLVPTVFFSGEVLDAFGPIGGHNFLWAFVTGRLAGSGAASG
ncbi:MAG: aminoacetone oxidase family FAD-binding enzyme [Thermotogota bacterium]